MLVEIFDVGHGACAMITSPNGRRMMIDCGTNPDRGWSPSIQFMNQTIDVLAISNFDEDHVTDFSNLHHLCSICRYQLNNSISAEALAKLKSETEMGQGIKAVHTVLTASDFVSGLTPLDLSPVSYRPYYNCYGQDFSDTNNLSLVQIIEYAGFKIIFPGDLEEAGWKKLLENPVFVQDLIGVTVFIASHHGRSSGCCAEVFEIWKPEIIVMSDRDKEFDSQETSSWYQQRSHGIRHGEHTKKIYTTRNNGNMAISVEPSSNRWMITVERL